MDCEKDYYIETALGMLLIVSELLAKSDCKHNSICEFIKHLVKCREPPADINLEETLPH